MAWNDPKEMADYCYTIDEPDMAEEILKLGTHIAELQAQLTEYKGDREFFQQRDMEQCREISRNHIKIKELQAQVDRLEEEVKNAFYDGRDNREALDRVKAIAKEYFSPEAWEDTSFGDWQLAKRVDLAEDILTAIKGEGDG